MSLKRVEALDQLAVQALEEKRLKSIKKIADIWIPSTPDKVVDGINIAIKVGAVDPANVRTGYAVGMHKYTNRGTISTGTLIFYDKTEQEIVPILTLSDPDKVKGHVKGAALDKMVAHRIKILADIVKALKEQDQQNRTITANHHGARKLTVDNINMPELRTVQAFKDYVTLIENNWLGGATWMYQRPFEQIKTEFVNEPFLTDENVSKGYDIAGLHFTMGE